MVNQSDPRLKYSPEFPEQARKLCELGATDREIGDFFGVCEKTITRWQQTYPEFAEAVQVGKKYADDRVEKSLYRRALGYVHDTQKIMTVDGKPKAIDITESVPPDTTACIFWLKNRRRREWRDRVDHELTGKDGAELPAIKVQFVEPDQR